MTKSIDFAENFGSQASALALIAGLAQRNPELPPAYIVSSWAGPDKVSAQLDSVSAIESWREALNVATEGVVLSSYGNDRRQLMFTAAVNDVRIDVWAPFTDVQSATETEGVTV